MTGQGSSPLSPSSYLMFFAAVVVFNTPMTVVLRDFTGPLGWLLSGANAFGACVLVFSLLRLNEVRLAVTQSSVGRVDRRAVRRAVVGGPAPAELTLRAVAGEIAAAELAFSDRYHWFYLIGLAVLGAFSVYCAVAQTPVAWIVVAVIGVATGYALAWRAVLRRRVELLSVAGCER